VVGLVGGGFAKRSKTYGRVDIDSEEREICSRCRSKRDILRTWDRGGIGVGRWEVFISSRLKRESRFGNALEKITAGEREHKVKF